MGVASAALPPGRAHPRSDGVVYEPDPDLPQLHAAAAALVHPSFHEGFGLTVLEAMRAGTPVIAGASAAAMLAPPDGEPGRTRALAFSWERSARAHVQAYTVALDRR